MKRQRSAASAASASTAAKRTRKRLRRSGTLPELDVMRREMNREAWAIAWEYLPEEVRALLRAQRGRRTPRIAMERLITALLSADDALDTFAKLT